MFQPPLYYEQKPEPIMQRIQLNRNYIWPLGVFRIAIILCLFGGFVSSLCIASDTALFYAFDDGSSGATRSALIVFFSVFLVISIITFATSISNLVNLPGLHSEYWLIAFIVLDLISILAFIILGILAGVRESKLGGLGELVGVRNGAFTACAVFAFFLAILQIISVVISIPYVIKLRQVFDEFF